MAKIITRTIKVYTYTTGKLDFKSMKIEGIKQHSFPYKLGKREESKLAAADGAPIVDISTGEALYGMSLETFMQYAKPITKEEAAELEVQEG